MRKMRDEIYFIAPCYFTFETQPLFILLLPPFLCAFSHPTFISVNISLYISRGFMVQLVITSLLRSEGPRFEPGWNHFYLPDHPFSSLYLSTLRLDYPFHPLSLVGSYQVGYTRSHPNTEVKMLRACSVPLCSHRWERQVIYLFVFLLIYKDRDNTIQYNIYEDNII